MREVATTGATILSKQVIRRSCWNRVAGACTGSLAAAQAGNTHAVSRESNMWRCIFLTLGIYACLLGGQALTVERAVLRPKSDQAITLRRL